MYSVTISYIYYTDIRAQKSLEMKVLNRYKLVLVNCNAVIETPHKVQTYLKNLSCNQVVFSLSLFLLHRDTCPPHYNKIDTYITQKHKSCSNLPLFITTGKHLCLSPSTVSISFDFLLTHLHKTLIYDTNSSNETIGIPLLLVLWRRQEC